MEVTKLIFEYIKYYQYVIMKSSCYYKGAYFLIYPHQAHDDSKG